MQEQLWKGQLEERAQRLRAESMNGVSRADMNLLHPCFPKSTHHPGCIRSCEHMAISLFNLMKVCVT